MDLSTAMFGYLLVDIRSVDHDAPSAAATEPNGPKKGGGVTTRPFLSKSDTYSGRFRGFDTCIRSANWISKHLARVVNSQSLPVRSVCWLSSGVVGVVQNNQYLVGLVNKHLIDFKDRHSIARSYFQSLNDPDDYKCLIDPVDVLRFEKSFDKAYFGYQLRAGCSVVVGMVVGYQGSDAQSTIDVVYEALDSSPIPKFQKKCLKYLRKICSLHNLPPSAMQIELLNIPANVFCRGGFANVFKYTDQGLVVAIKVIRTYSTSDMQMVTRRFYKEAITWKFLRHPNVLPLLGVPKDRSQLEFSMVSDWMANGTINEFVNTHGEANRFKLLADVASGLIYLHDQGIIHKDLKGDNILVDQSGNARLADFGLITISDSSSFEQGGSLRWMSPELLDPESFGLKDSRGTKSSDCYALGMVVYEVLSGHKPFYRCAVCLVVVHRVLRGERPERPQEIEGEWFTGGIWGILEHCWKREPSDRPSINSVLQCLEEASKFWTPPSSSLMEVDPPVPYSSAQTSSNLSIGWEQDSDTFSNN